MAKVYITIQENKIVATPVGYCKSVKDRFRSFGGAQKPWVWDGESWVIDGAKSVSYWAEKVKTMFFGWKVNPAEIHDAR